MDYETAEGALDSSLTFSTARGSLFIKQSVNNVYSLISNFNYAVKNDLNSYGRYPDGANNFKLMLPTPVDTNVNFTYSTDVPINKGTVQTNDNYTSIYPVPVKNILNISSQYDIQSVELFNIQGALLISEKEVNSIQTSYLPEGIYFVKIHTSNGISKFLITKQ